MAVQSSNSESTPLLDTDHSAAMKIHDSPVPWVQLSLLIMARMLDLGVSLKLIQRCRSSKH